MIKTSTTATFNTTKKLLIEADSCVPLIRSRESIDTIKIAGKLIKPPSITVPSLKVNTSQGEHINFGGR